MLELLAKLQKIDRRWVYLFVFIACTIPFIHRMWLPISISPETKSLYDCIENKNKLPENKDKVVLIESSWDAGSMGENQGQIEVVVDHLFRNDIKFAIFAMNNALAPQFSEPVIDKLAKKYNKKYGIDWVNLGTKMGVQDWQVMQRIAKDFHGQFPTDYKNQSVEDLPLMGNLHKIDDIYMIYAVTYTPSENWLAFVHGPYGTPVAYGCAGIQSTTYYRYVASRQLCGMLVGIRGSAEYDSMLYPRDDQMKDRKSLGTKLIIPLSFGHIVIIVAIIVGNIGYFAARRRRM